MSSVGGFPMELPLSYGVPEASVKTGFIESVDRLHREPQAEARSGAGRTVGCRSNPTCNPLRA